MSLEIERKFLIEKLPKETEGLIPQKIEQGYLALEAGGREVRLRRQDQYFFLTVKSFGDLLREEYEVSLSEEQFSKLWPGTLGRRICKDRYVLNRSSCKVEIDRYRQPLTGLLIAEIEFPSIEAAQLFQKEAWMGLEVTHLNFLKNRELFQFKDLNALKKFL